jgi:hypothetical protein
MDRWRWAIGALVAIHLLAGVRVMLATDWEQPSFTTGDHLQYRALVAEPGWPYRDKTVAFPPVTYLAFEAIEGHGTATTGGRLLVLTQLACDLAVAAALAAGWGRRAATAWLVLLLPLLWDGWVLARIDLLSVALALGGLALVRRGDSDGDWRRWGASRWRRRPWPRCGRWPCCPALRRAPVPSSPLPS